VVIISLCGFFLEREAVEGQIYQVLQDFIGNDTAAQLQELVKNAAINNSGLAAVIGIITLLIGATTVFAEIQDSVNYIWGLKPKPKRGWLKYLQNRFLSFSVIISLGFLLLVSLAVTGIVESLNVRLQRSFPEVTVIVFYIVNLLLTLGICMLIFAVIFKVLPDANIRWKDVFVGALITSVLFLLGKFGISLYVSQTKIGTTYGAAGSLAVILVWIYYSSIILYTGAEFTRAYAVHFGREIRPSHYAVTTKEVEIELPGAPIEKLST
ncbi:MAG: YihY/virulence factor BrkB family protein, partial [Chitinophagaceae bacterium]